MAGINKINLRLGSSVASSLLSFLILFRLPKIKEYVDAHDPGATIIPFSGAFESKLIDLDEEARKAFIEESKNTR